MIAKKPRSVVTGAAGGLGRAFALELAGRGGRLLLSDIDESGLAETAALAKIAGAERVEAMRCDVANALEVDQMRARAEADFGGCDLLVNNAGVAVAGPIGEVPLADWEWIMGVNLWGPIHGCHSFVPLMKRQGTGHILNVASIAGIAQAPQMAPYNVTKSGVISLSETLSGEVAEFGIGVTVLCPYFFKTNIHNASRAHGKVGKSQALVGKLMEKTTVQAADVARLALQACDRGELYALPHNESKAMFVVKRLVPGLFHQKIAPLVAKRSLAQ
jgi:NAD(P)-dependent dehydrogenase (short-subunit alcohol dehydrogenase family)